MWFCIWIATSGSPVGSAYRLQSFLVTQRALLQAERWIADSNDVDEDLIVERADTLIVLNTPWWLCSLRALKRGIRRPRQTQLPNGCEESFTQRISDEWQIAWRNLRNRHSIQQRELARASLLRNHLKVHVFNSRDETAQFLTIFSQRESISHSRKEDTDDAT